MHSKNAWETLQLIYIVFHKEAKITNDNFYPANKLQSLLHVIIIYSKKISEIVNVSSGWQTAGTFQEIKICR